jgi:hypothetical protein
MMRAEQLLGTGVPPERRRAARWPRDQSQLNRQFRRIVGTTPGRYAEPQFG